MTKKLKYIGANAHRLRDNPEEARFAAAWDEQQRLGHTLAYLLDPRHGTVGRPPDPTDDEHRVASTVIQWLGSPVGRSFLEELGYRRKDTP